MSAEVFAHQRNSTARRPASGSEVDAAERITSWLLSPEVQIRAGQHAGGVSGWCGPELECPFVYSEITGYYLTFLAYLARFAAAEWTLLTRIRSAAAWLQAHCSIGSNYLTRWYLDNHNDRDWRNQFIFSFDLAMILRGVVAIKDFLDTSSYRSLRTALLFRLGHFSDETHGLRAAIACGGGFHPTRWSIEPGPYQLKAAMALSTLSEPVPKTLRAAAQQTAVHWQNYLPEDVNPDGLHQAFYFMEGLVFFGLTRKDRTRLQHAEAAYIRALDHQNRRLFYAPENLRSDVVAQALRLGVILQRYGYLQSPSWLAFLDQLAELLFSFCGPNGAVYFRRDADGHLLHANAWSSMFAVQAFRLYDSLRQGIPNDLGRIELLV